MSRVDHMPRILAIYKTTFKQLSRVSLRRAITLNTEPRELVDYAVVYSESGSICHICMEDITVGPGKKAQMLQFDHIQPLSRGGGHVKNNIACAHAQCNIAKGNGYE